MAAQARRFPIEDFAVRQDDTGYELTEKDGVLTLARYPSGEAVPLPSVHDAVFPPARNDGQPSDEDKANGIMRWRYLYNRAAGRIVCDGLLYQELPLRPWHLVKTWWAEAPIDAGLPIVERDHKVLRSFYAPNGEGVELRELINQTDDNLVVLLVPSGDVVPATKNKDSGVRWDCQDFVVGDGVVSAYVRWDDGPAVKPTPVFYFSPE